MHKYRNLFLDSLAQSIDKLKGSSAAEGREVYRLLHSVRGTAGTLGLDRFSLLAAEWLEQLDEEDDSVWPEETLKRLLGQLEAAARELQSAAASLQAEAAGVPESRTAAQAKRSLSGQASGTLGLQEHASEKSALVLVLDDDPALLQAVKDGLETAGWMVLAVQDAKQAERLFFEMNPDLVMLNILLTAESGFDVLRRIAPLAENAFVPVMMMSGKTDKATRIRCYEEGADAFLAKPVDLEELVPWVARLLERRIRLKRMLLQDPLTGAHTRMFFRMELQRRLAVQAQPGSVEYVACFDIDGFGEINDYYGHSEGNRLLTELARLIRRVARGGDMLIRDHGDRFFLMMAREKPEDAAQTVEEVLREFKAAVRRTELGSYSRTASAGLAAVLSPGAEPEEWLDRAQQAMRSAKADGGGLLRIFDQEHPSCTLPQLRVAIVDDDPLLCQMLQRQLDGLGGPGIRTDIRTYPDGEQFLEDEWHTGPGTTLLVLDRLMPRMNGMEVLRRLRASYDRRKYRIVMLTGVDADADVASAIEEGTDDYLTKPFSLVELEARLKRFVRGIRK
ncbi:response regulator [Gorillibacterium sp. sgz5001074]|uniref:response regulator n=1 Tax=Gorillibacterium sp. sgz5001074 TaxID=3446695 RepID=UPI003F67DD8A